MKNIAIIDIESQGASTSYSSIISIAGILVNPDLKEIERFELNCRNKAGHVPDPYSLWVNKGFYQMKKSNSSHYQLMKELHKIINQLNISYHIVLSLCLGFLLKKINPHICNN